jgi:uncharacterized small protein (DUF1192 family)
MNSEEKDAEIERLNGELLDQTDRRHWLTNENESQRKLIAELNAEIERLKTLLSRAADALEDLRGPGWKRELIAELRKAGE